MTLEDADKVSIQQAGATLCAILIGDLKGPDVDNVHHCTQADMTLGDYCSTSAKACPGSGDSFWLAATFAATR